MLRAVPTFWHRSVNFGDQIAPYLVEKITGLKPVFVSNEEQIEHIALVGSLLDAAPLNNTHIWGCGFAHREGLTYKPKKIHAVRGELSYLRYKNEKIKCPRIFGDPALLLPGYYNPSIEKKYKVGIIPHVAEYIEVLENYANRWDGFTVIDLSKPVESVIDRILSCEKVISSSLHGLIVSEAYEIPNQWVEFSDKVIGEGFKFLDYGTTLVKPIHPVDLRTFTNIENIVIHKNIIKISLTSLYKSCPLI